MGDPEVVGLLASILASLVAVIVLIVRGTRDAKEAAFYSQRTDAAVNNRPHGQPNMYDQVMNLRDDVAELVEAQRDFAKRGWPTLPDDIGTAARLTETIRELQHDAKDQGDKLDRLEGKVDNLADRLVEHDHWERSQKYDDQ